MEIWNMDDSDIDIMRWLLEKYCLDNECVLSCKSRERLLKRTCEVAKFIKYVSDNKDKMNMIDTMQKW